MDNEQETGGSGVSRGQNQLHIAHEDWAAAAEVVTPLLERLDAGSGVQLVVVTSDTEAAAGVGERLAAAARDRGLRVVSATSVRRATRLMRAAAPHVVLGDAPALHALLESAMLKLDAVKVVVLGWIDETPSRETKALEAVMAEMPKDAARVVFASAVTPALEALVERYARRARRVSDAASETTPPVSLSFVSTSASGRLAALRRVIDAMDPASAFVFVRDAATRQAVQESLAGLGYASDTGGVRVGDAPAGASDLLVFFDLPRGEEQLRALVTAQGGGRTIALVTPRQLASLRRAAGGTVSPFVLPDAAQRARSREDALRDELRQVLDNGQFSREVLALEPLLAEYDATEIAGAALRLLEAERARANEPLPASAPRPMTRLYLNVGGTDNVAPGDVIGAIMNEAGIARAELGKVDVRDRHSTVEVATPIANAVVSKLTGVTIRGRRVIARVDEGPPRPERGGARGDRSERPRRDDARGGGGPRGPRGPGGPRGPRRSPSGDREGRGKR